MAMAWCVVFGPHAGRQQIKREYSFFPHIYRSMMPHETYYIGVSPLIVIFIPAWLIVFLSPCLCSSFHCMWPSLLSVCSYPPDTGLRARTCTVPVLLVSAEEATLPKKRGGKRKPNSNLKLPANRTVSSVRRHAACTKCRHVPITNEFYAVFSTVSE
jgi:hypothetical protein